MSGGGPLKLLPEKNRASRKLAACMLAESRDEAEITTDLDRLVRCSGYVQPTFWIVGVPKGSWFRDLLVEACGNRGD